VLGITLSFLTFCPFFKREEKDQKKRKERGSPKEKKRKEKVTSNALYY
jgi:hypothetical protein